MHILAKMALRVCSRGVVKHFNEVKIKEESMRVLNYITGLLAVSLVFVSPALAEEAGAVFTTDGMKALALGIAVLGGTLGQSRVVTAAVESISRNPGAAGEMKQPWFLALAFIESLVILCWLYAAKFVG
jgi:F0F1-type ATP synthase membrane subunit c/vacuolar-type H+-ATPase subunit K